MKKEKKNCFSEIVLKRALDKDSYCQKISENVGKLAKWGDENSMDASLMIKDYMLKEKEGLISLIENVLDGMIKFCDKKEEEEEEEDEIIFKIFGGKSE